MKIKVSFIADIPDAMVSDPMYNEEVLARDVIYDLFQSAMIDKIEQQLNIVVSDTDILRQKAIVKAYKTEKAIWKTILQSFTVEKA
jgi:hypothetical protein